MSFKNSSLETPGCDMYCGTTPASDVAATHRKIHYDVSITFKYRLFNICFTFGQESKSSTTLFQLPPIRTEFKSAATQPLSNEILVETSLPSLGTAQKSPCKRVPPKLCSKKKTVAIVTSSLPARNWLSLPS